MQTRKAPSSHRPADQPTRLRIRVEGIVQGVGFRPYIHGLANRFGLAGIVGNDGDGVFIEIEGRYSSVTAMLERIGPEAPPLAVIEQVSSEEMPVCGLRGFIIAQSEETGRSRRTLVSPDTSTCDECIAEIFDPSARRYLYPFTNCTHCGPRFTIIAGVPYDRATTTMAQFPMCAACSSEYHDPTDRRFHAQPVCCPECGPTLRLTTPSGDNLHGDPLFETVSALRDGRIVAIKGLGGYHLAVRASDESAVATLRSRKHREDKPFAVMASDLQSARMLCAIDTDEEALLSSPARPIVLLQKNADAPLAQSVAPGNDSLGIMLPYTPLHYLLARMLNEPFVLTSGNVSDEPIAYQDERAYLQLREIADLFLVHNRPILTRTDDSVARIFNSKEMVIRRSRGYVPKPLPVAWPFVRPVLACGPELKNTFALAKGKYVFVSHHIGDLQNYETYRSFSEGIHHFSRLFDVHPSVVAHDLHPEYLSTKHATELHDVELIGVQHHHAHIASCMADNGEIGPVIGIAFDGLGFGLDGTIWGGEILVATLSSFERIGALEGVAMPGGAAAIREPWRMAAAYLDAAFDGQPPASLPLMRKYERWNEVVSMARGGINSPVTSSAGRLFDAVAAIAGIREEIHYEGQAAIELEQCIDRTETGVYGMSLRDGDPFRIDTLDVIRSATTDALRGVAPSVVAARFHNGLAEGVVAAALRAQQLTGLSTVALSGGVFQNRFMLERVLNGLATRGFRTLVHSRVPANDGGISFGQAVIAGAIDRSR